MKIQIQNPKNKDCIVEKGFYSFKCKHCGLQYRARKYRTGDQDVWKYVATGEDIEADVFENLRDSYQQNIDSDIPMGVSQWKEYGIKYGYWEYFKKSIVEQVEK